jgi:hypothetical protein
MLREIGLAILFVGSAGCVLEDEHERHHHRAAVVEPGHVHGPGCGHVFRGGIWVDDD